MIVKVYLMLEQILGGFLCTLQHKNLNRMVYAFEPVPETFKYLKSNITRNELDGQITCFNYALSDTNGSFKIYVVEANGTNASLKNVFKCRKRKRDFMSYNYVG